MWRLQRLVLQDCGGSAGFLDAISLRNTTLSLKRLVIISGREAQQTSLGNALDRMLFKIKGLELLAVSGAIDHPPNAKALAAHAMSLKALYVANPHHRDWQSMDNWVKEVCCICVRLKQFALPVHSLAFHAPEPKNVDLKVQTTSSCGAWNTFSALLHSIVSLPEFTTLRLLGIFHGDQRLKQSDSAADIVARRPDALAESILLHFHESGQRRVSVITLERLNGVLSSEGPLCYFVKGSRLEDWLTKRASMVQMCAARVRSEEPRSDILDIGAECSGLQQ